MKTIPVLRIEFLDARVRVRMLNDGRVLLVEQQVDEPSAGAAEPLGDGLPRSAGVPEGGALPLHAMENASEGSSSCVSLPPAGRFGRPQGSPLQAMENASEGSSSCVSLPPAGRFGRPQGSPLHAMENVSEGSSSCVSVVPEGVGDALVGALSSSSAEEGAALGSLSACLAASGGPSVEELAAWVERTRGSMSPRAAWYVVYRLLRESCGLRMSGNRFTLAVNALCRYGWRKAGFRDIPLAFRELPVGEWSGECTGHLSSGRAYAALAQAFARLLG